MAVREVRELMAQQTDVRRVPALLTALAALVVLIALLGLTGLLNSPKPVPGLSASGGQAAVGLRSSESNSVQAAAVGAEQVSRPADHSGATAPVALATARLTTATAELLQVLAAPADDAATPGQQQAVAAADPSAAATALPAESGEGRRAVYSINSQRVWLVEADGTVARTYPVSGRLDRPGPGTYQVYSKSPTAISYDYTETMKYMVRFAHGENSAIGFHDIPVLNDGTPAQTEAQLGQPLSAGCVRQAEPDAEYLWGWAQVGTTVVVVS